jgi:hypothetical protein
MSLAGRRDAANRREQEDRNSHHALNTKSPLRKGDAATARASLTQSTLMAKRS